MIIGGKSNLDNVENLSDCSKYDCLNLLM